MATTLRVVSELVTGVRDTSGNVVASGLVYFYQPGTTVQQTVYQDNAAATPYVQPVTLNAQGQKRYVYTLEPVRMVVKDSTGVTTHLDIDPVNLVRADTVYMTHASINSGTETTVEAEMVRAATSLGTGYQYKESATATARDYTDVIGEMSVNVEDFGAVGDGSTDDTASIQAASDEVKARGGGWLLISQGTYKITSAINIDTAGVSWKGVGRGISIIKNFSTSGNAITVNLGSAIDSKLVLRDFSITASTTSSGTGIAVTNGDRIRIENVMVALHRTGISASAVSDAKLLDCIVASTDDNAAAVGVSLGARCRMVDCDVISGTTNGTGVSNASAADAKVYAGYVSKFATGITLGGAGSVVNGTTIASSTTGITASGTAAVVMSTHISSVTTGITLSGTGATAEANYIATATTGISMTAADTGAVRNRLDTATTGISTGAVANCRIVANTFTGGTTDVSVNASATSHYDVANTYIRASNPRITVSTIATVTPTFTPTTECSVFVCDSSYAAGNTTATVAATATTGLVDGQPLILVFQKTGANNITTITYNAQYLFATVSANSCTSETFHVIPLFWSAVAAKWIGGATLIAGTAGSPFT